MSTVFVLGDPYEVPEHDGSYEFWAVKVKPKQVASNSRLDLRLSSRCFVVLINLQVDGDPKKQESSDRDVPAGNIKKGKHSAEVQWLEFLREHPDGSVENERPAIKFWVSQGGGTLQF